METAAGTQGSVVVGGECIADAGNVNRLDEFETLCLVYPVIEISDADYRSFWLPCYAFEEEEGDADKPGVSG